MRSPVDMDGTPDRGSREAIIGRSKPMQDIYKAIGRVSPTEATVLIRGESGTGKELVARAVYQHSQRAGKPFQVINCVAIPETLLESELFGYEKGAFTGAAHRRLGKIEQANGGTVFLDEIGDMPFSIQSKILRLLQEKSIERLGGRETIPVDVRIIAATNRDLEAALQQGRFREDLYYRLKVVTIALPPLRERTDDLPLLTEYFMARYARELDMDSPGITHEAVAVLKAHMWPGNVRELANAVHKALIFNRGAPIRPPEMSQAVDPAAARYSTEKGTDRILRQWVREVLAIRGEGNTFDAIMDQFAGILVGEALNLTQGNRSRAAKLLGLSRPTLHSKIDRYRLKFKTSVEGEPL
jgi:DNA-binding NtrC family response regulator